MTIQEIRLSQIREKYNHNSTTRDFIMNKNDYDELITIIIKQNAEIKENDFFIAGFKAGQEQIFSQIRELENICNYSSNLDCYICDWCQGLVSKFDEISHIGSCLWEKANK